MKTAILLGIVSIGLVLAHVSSSGLEKNEEELLVEKVIQDSTKKYDERMEAAFLNGAQSKKNHRELKKSTKYTQKIGRISSIYLDAFKELINTYKIDRTTALNLLRQELPEECELEELGCDPTAKYRSYRGTCNNLNHPYWGSINMPNVRLIEPAYENTDEPRGGLVSNLPAARDITLKIHRDSSEGENFEVSATHMVPQFGQFLDHDITLTPVDNLACCGEGPRPDGCWPIDVNSTDPFYQDSGTLCLDFVRSTPACFPSPGIDHREQMNIQTSYIDAGMVYGPTEQVAAVLRAYRKGKLAENTQFSGFLPYRKEVVPGDESVDVIIAGDVRANEMPGLTVMHSLFLREHNRIAETLAIMTDWDDEKVYQETRRIIAAEIQQVTYNEFLPSILGQEAMTRYGLALPPVTENNGYTDYDSTVDATIISSFATAAYRFGHTLVNGLIQLIFDETIVGYYRVRENYLISDQIIKSDYADEELKVTGYDLILNGLIRQKAQAFDSEIHKDMSDELFKGVGFIGTDLAARNVQRGRDHGTPSYNSFRIFCNLTPLTDWDNRPAEISQTAWDRLREVYAVPEDIDLYTGGLSQTPVQGGLSGPTFVCIQAIQFQRLMKGDRFFFTHSGQSGSFTSEQLAALRSRTLGDIICENSALKETARNVFQISSSTENPMVSCTEDSRQLDISLFAEEPVDPTTNPSTESSTEPTTDPTTDPTTPPSSGTVLSSTIAGLALCIASSLLF